MPANRESLSGNGFPGLRIEWGEPDAEEITALVVVLAVMAAREASADKRPAWTGRAWRPETGWRLSGPCA
jgi:hypothetical protein